MAPEALLPGPTTAIDIWALAVLAIEAAAPGELVGDVVRTQQQVDALVRKIPPTFSQAITTYDHNYIGRIYMAITIYAISALPISTSVAST